MRHSLLLLLLCMSGFMAAAQTYSPGYIVLRGTRDTLNGLIYEAPGGKVGWKQEREAYVRWYKENEISAINIGDETYVNLTVEVLRSNFPQLVYARLTLIQSGKIQLLQYDADDLYGHPHTNYYLRRGEGKPFRVPETPSVFEKLVSAYLEDNADVSGRVRSGEWKYAQIREIVATYNGMPVPEAPASEQENP